MRTAEILSQEPLGIQNVEEFLQDRIDYALSDNCYGCLLVNTVSEREVVSKKINDKIDKIMANQESLILKCNDAAIKSGQISKNNNSRALTDYLSCFFRGLMNMAKSPNKNKASLKNMGTMALSPIER
ncbi:MAG: TetR family transcriptional regulator C-terminal domain-containing protein [Proteobacteria bacterium]|nr:TetR family transcriptional regulator C-terminal domain-containing protein [Pseudomonadota bacterium]